MIKPDCYKNIGKIVGVIEKAGFVIANIKMARMTIRDSQDFYGEHQVWPTVTLGKTILRRANQIHVQRLRGWHGASG